MKAKLNLFYGLHVMTEELHRIVHYFAANAQLLQLPWNALFVLLNLNCVSKVSSLWKVTAMYLPTCRTPREGHLTYSSHANYTLKITIDTLIISCNELLEKTMK